MAFSRRASFRSCLKHAWETNKNWTMVFCCCSSRRRLLSDQPTVGATMANLHRCISEKEWTHHGLLLLPGLKQIDNWLGHERVQKERNEEGRIGEVKVGALHVLGGRGEGRREKGAWCSRHPFLSLNVCSPRARAVQAWPRVSRSVVRYVIISGFGFCASQSCIPPS